MKLLPPRDMIFYEFLEDFMIFQLQKLMKKQVAALPWSCCSEVVLIQRKPLIFWVDILDKQQGCSEEHPSSG